MMELLLLHLAATWFMAGLVCFVHVVAYPLLAVVPVDAAVRFEQAHMRRTGWLVPLPMAVEGITCLIISLKMLESPLQNWLWWVNAAGYLAVFLLTFLVMVPLHEKLARGFDAKLHRQLIVTNRWRVLLWPGRGILLLWLLRDYLK
jgi:hypothetical protein